MLFSADKHANIEAISTEIRLETNKFSSCLACLACLACLVARPRLFVFISRRLHLVSLFFCCGANAPRVYFPRVVSTLFVVVFMCQAVALNCGARVETAAAFYLPLAKIVRALELIQRGEKVSGRFRSMLGDPTACACDCCCRVLCQIGRLLSLMSGRSLAPPGSDFRCLHCTKLNEPRRIQVIAPALKHLLVWPRLIFLFLDVWGTQTMTIIQVLV